MQLSKAVEGYLLFKATRASATTIKTDTVILVQFQEWRGDPPITEVSPDDVRDYLAHHRERGLSPYTLRRHHATVSALYRWLEGPEVNLAESNPCDAVPRPKLPRRKPTILSEQDVTAVIQACTESLNPRRDKALTLFLLDTGARASEVTGVRMNDVNLNTGKVKVVGKGDKERYVYLGKRALSAVWLYVEEERPEPSQVRGDYLFLTGDGYPMNRDSLRNAMKRLGKTTGVHCNPHKFRHTAAVEHLRHGMDLVSIQHMLGHASISTTRVYLEALEDEDVEERARRTSPADNWRL